MNRQTAKQIANALEHIGDVLQGFPEALTHLEEVAPFIKAFGDGKAIAIQDNVIATNNAEIAFDAPAINYAVIPGAVRVRVDGRVFNVNFAGAVLAGLVERVP